VLIPISRCTCGGSTRSSDWRTSRGTGDRYERTLPAGAWSPRKESPAVDQVSPLVCLACRKKADSPIEGPASTASFPRPHPAAPVRPRPGCSPGRRRTRGTDAHDHTRGRITPLDQLIGHQRAPGLLHHLIRDGTPPAEILNHTSAAVRRTAASEKYPEMDEESPQAKAQEAADGRDVSIKGGASAIQRLCLAA
jgi:hypothetical protein